MLWIIISVLLAIVIICRIFPVENAFDISFVAISCVMAGVMVALVVYNVEVAFAPQTSGTKIEFVAPLVSAKVGGSWKIEGAFSGGIFVSRGYIEGGSKVGFLFYQQEGEGTILKEIPADRTTIKYSDEPRIVTNSYFCEDPEIGLWGVAYRCSTPEPTYTLYVPEGSIVGNIDLNL